MGVCQCERQRELVEDKDMNCCTQSPVIKIAITRGNENGVKKSRIRGGSEREREV